MEKWIECLLERAGAEVYVHVLNVIVHNIHETRLITRKTERVSNN